MAQKTEIVTGIERGLADMKQDRLVPHAEAMARLRKTVDAARNGKMRCKPPDALGGSAASSPTAPGIGPGKNGRNS